jgi:hypothetical protein
MTQWTTRAAAAVLAAVTATIPVTAQAQTLYTETFEGVSPLNTGFYGAIPNTALTTTHGYSRVLANDPTPGRGQYLDLPTAFYQCFCADPTVTVQSTGTFDLFAGYVYSLSFDWSRSPVLGGNGPFNVSLTASVGNQSVTYSDVAGFYYGFDWSTGLLTWTQGADELGAHIKLFASGELYSGMLVDNLTLVAVAPSGTVPEPATYLLMTSGLLGVALRTRRRRLME